MGFFAFITVEGKDNIINKIENEYAIINKNIGFL